MAIASYAQFLTERKLSAKARGSLPASDFALKVDGEEKYPVEDKAHAANAKSRASQQKKKGHLTQSQYNTVVAKANKVLGEDSLADTVAYNKTEALAHLQAARNYGEGTHWHNVAMLKHHKAAGAYHNLMGSVSKDENQVAFHKEREEKHGAMQHRFRQLCYGN